MCEMQGGKGRHAFITLKTFLFNKKQTPNSQHERETCASLRFTNMESNKKKKRHRNIKNHNMLR